MIDRTPPPAPTPERRCLVYCGDACVCDARHDEAGHEVVFFPSDEIIIGKLELARIVIGDIIAIRPDGSIERLSGFTTNEAAALAFWEAVDRFMPKAKDGPGDQI